MEMGETATATVNSNYKETDLKRSEIRVYRIYE
jgi:hypothetical protein